MIKLKKTEIIILILTIIYLIIAAIIYPQLPEQIATHWNAEGIADDFSPKLFGVLIMPFFFVFVLVIYSLFSRTEYFKQKEIGKQLSTTITMSILFLFFISILSLIYNVGIKFNMSYFMIPATSILLIALGIILKNVKTRNPFFGIRTPWTLLDQETWEKTHVFASKVFIILGILLLTSIFYLKHFAIIFMITLLGSVVIIFVYSYHIYKKKKK